MGTPGTGGMGASGGDSWRGKAARTPLWSGGPQRTQLYCNPQVVKRALVKNTDSGTNLIPPESEGLRVGTGDVKSSQDSSCVCWEASLGAT